MRFTAFNASYKILTGFYPQTGKENITKIDGF